MIDFHSHILPGIDDGSRDVEESISLLKMLKEQGVKTVVATPHFYADQQSMESFLANREQALARLKAEYSEGLPEIICGAEVLYYSGISKLADLNKLCIEGTKLLLLEMPMAKWTEYTVRELMDMAGRTRLRIVIAHLDRYMHYQSKDVIAQLYEYGFLIQMNASFFLNFSTKGRALRMLKNQEIHMIGSDCHSVTSRPSHIGEAYSVIRKKCGEELLEDLTGYGYHLLNR